MNVSIVVPVFDATEALPELLQRLFAVAALHQLALHVVLVDDGSGPEAWLRLKALRQTWPGRDLVLLRLARNCGQQAATLCGLLHCRAPVAVTLDADLQHPPEEIPRLLAALAPPCDLVYGTAQAGQPRLRRIAGTLFKTLTRPLGGRFVSGTAFRALRLPPRAALEVMTRRRFLSLDHELQACASGIAVVAVSHQVRAHGASAYSWPGLVVLGARLLLASGRVPRAVGGLGLALVLAGWVPGPEPPAIGAAWRAWRVAAGMALLLAAWCLAAAGRQPSAVPLFTVAETLE